MYEQFRCKAEAVGAEVHRCRTREEAGEFIRQFLCSEGVTDCPGRYAVWAAGPFLSGIDTTRLAAENPGLTFEVTRELAAAAHIGISEADWAMADTGSLVADQAVVEQRLVSTLPTIHVALIATERILADKVAVFERINPATSRYIAFITGPSRTADIERVLTIGVHGPKRLVIICVDEPGGITP